MPSLPIAIGDASIWLMLMQRIVRFVVKGVLLEEFPNFAVGVKLEFGSVVLDGQELVVQPGKRDAIVAIEVLDIRGKVRHAVGFLCTATAELLWGI